MWASICCGKVKEKTMVICRVLMKGLKMIFQKIKDLKDFLKLEEDREGSRKIGEAFKNLSEEEISEYKRVIEKIRKILDDIETYIEKYRNFPS
jgi:tRNA threonylcarbamoyladenosine modification (KEOPS) complex Cgi121 subunit